MEKIIAFDADDTLIGTTKVLNKFYNKAYNARLRFEDYYTFDLCKLWGINFNTFLKIEREFYASEFGNKIPLEKRAFEVIDHLVKEGFKLPVITGRGQDIEHYLLATLEKFFKDYHFSSIHHVGSGLSKKPSIPKHQKCLEEGARVLVDDHYGNIVPVTKKGIHGILITKPWNKYIIELPKLATRARNIDEALDIIYKKEKIIWPS